MAMWRDSMQTRLGLTHAGSITTPMALSPHSCASSFATFMQRRLFEATHCCTVQQATLLMRMQVGGQGAAAGLRARHLPHTQAPASSDLPFQAPHATVLVWKRPYNTPPLLSSFLPSCSWMPHSQPSPIAGSHSMCGSPAKTSRLCSTSARRPCSLDTRAHTMPNL